MATVRSHNFREANSAKPPFWVALAPRPEVLLLDEPAAGLDPAARRELINELIDLLSQGHGCTVLSARTF